jgi:hypothetical protein
MANRRIFYATQTLGLAPLGSNSYIATHGVQSVGVNTNFTLDQILELGKISLYQLVEQVPEIELTASKVLDGYAPLMCLATQGAPNASLVGRSNQRCSIALAIFSDVQESASGTAVSQMVCSGMYYSQSSFSFNTDGQFTESFTAVGNNKSWLTTGFTYTPTYLTTDAPLALSGSGGVNIRQHMIFYPIITGVTTPGYTQEKASTLDPNGQVAAFLTILPPDIPGISSSGTNDRTSDGQFGAHIQSITTSVNLGRDSILELGRKEPYFRFANFPVEVNTDITVTSTQGDMVQALELGVTGDGNNLTDRSIRLRAREGTFINLGQKNKLSSINYSGGDTGGGQVSVTYSYKTFSDYTVTHPDDPSNLPYPY